MTRLVSLYAAVLGRSLKARLAYKADFFGELLAGLLGTAAGLVFVVLLFHRAGTLRGWTREEVLFIYGLSLVPFGLFNLFALNLYEFAERYIIEGRFDRLLLRPLPTLAQLLLEEIRLSALHEVLVGGAVLFWAGRRLGIALGPLDLLWLAAAVLAGAVIFLSVFTTIAALSFFFEDRIGISPPVYNLIQFGRFPVPLFSRPLRVVLSWVVPFAFVAFYPATHFLDRAGFRLLCYGTPAVALLSAAVCLLVWRLGVRNYRSTGT